MGYYTSEDVDDVWMSSQIRRISQAYCETNAKCGIRLVFIEGRLRQPVRLLCKLNVPSDDRALAARRPSKFPEVESGNPEDYRVVGPRCCHIFTKLPLLWFDHKESDNKRLVAVRELCSMAWSNTKRLATVTIEVARWKALGPDREGGPPSTRATADQFYPRGQGLHLQALSSNPSTHPPFSSLHPLPSS